MARTVNEAILEKGRQRRERIIQIAEENKAGIGVTMVRKQLAVEGKYASDNAVRNDFLKLVSEGRLEFSVGPNVWSFKIR